MIKKIKYNLENWYYQTRYNKPIVLNNFKLKENYFSGKKLNILYLSYYDGPYTYNNVVQVIEQIGNVYRFEMTNTPHEKNWYEKKEFINQKMLDFVDKTIKNVNIDVILCYVSGHSSSPKIIEKIKKYNIPMINESLDDERKFRSRKGKDGIYRGNKDICKYFSLTLTTSKSAIVKYLVEGGKPIYKDYCGNEKIYKKLYLAKEYDISFIGANYGIRTTYIHYLQKNGLKVYCRGKGWDAGTVTDEEMIEIFNKSKIVLGFSTVGKNDDIHILKGRDFEVPLTGSFYITGYHEELKEYFELGKDIETYTSKEDLLQKIHYYLTHENERESIAQYGYQKCLEEYTAKQAYEKIFGYLGL